MQAAANISLVLTDSSSFKFADSQSAIGHGGFYQQVVYELVKGVHGERVSREMGDRLVVLAEQAHAFRQMDALEHVGQILVTLSLPPQYEAVGRYYQALCIHRFGCGDIEQAGRLLETVTENAPPRYKARAMISLGARPRRQGDYQTALSLYREAGRFVSRSGTYDPYATLHTQKMVAVIHGLEGDHRNALALLENLFPLAHSMRSSHPHVYYDYMNSLAVELCEVGRLEEAKNVSQIVIVSPLAAAYPEWRETREEIELRGHRAPRSVVAFTQRLPEAGNVVRLPAPEIDDSARTLESVPGDPKPSGRVLSLLDWKKKKMPEKSNGGSQRNYQEMSGRELLLKIMELTAESDITDYELLRIVEAIETILSAPKDPGKQ